MAERGKRSRWSRWWMARVNAPCWLRGLMVRGWDGHCWAAGLVSTPDGCVECCDCYKTVEVDHD